MNDSHCSSEHTRNLIQFWRTIINDIAVELAVTIFDTVSWRAALESSVFDWRELCGVWDR